MESAPLAELTRPGASPGLLRRRYSVPETIMRKYRLAQQRSDSEESLPATSRSAASASPTPADAAHRFARRDRELMRKSALMRRMWGRADCRGCCCCGDEPTPCSRETRSLDGSRSELRHLSSGLASSRYSQAAAGWTTPKRQRLDTRDFRGSDEMLRAAMRNSYDRADASRDRVARTDLSDSTYRSHGNHVETLMDPFTDSDVSKCEERSGSPVRGAYTRYSEQNSSDTATNEIKSVDDTYVTGEPSQPQVHVHNTSDEQLFSASSDTLSASLCTAKDTLERSRIEGMHNEHVNANTSKRDDHNMLPYHEPLVVDTATSYEVLEIVVSESSNRNPVPIINTPQESKDNKRSPNILYPPLKAQTREQIINIDEYVSNILVESLNSLTDQLECMSASIGSDRKINIVEKEIKVKLQNTGVNTIVHLSPTSNNQIIFGNEELCNEEGRRDACNNAITIFDEPVSIESNNNVASSVTADAAERCPCESFDIHHDNVNQAVLHQIQKLFKDEMNAVTPANYLNMPEISHIETSDVDVFLDNAEAELAAQEEQTSNNYDPCQYEVISSVGAGNYYTGICDNPVVPRFSALPHTDSMEVNTSSSEDADVIGSDCTSLVDSLDDPNSPRSVLLRKAYSGRRGELVRSAIDVLDLLPENTHNQDTPREKPESFFIGIKENGHDCDKENVKVADRMPEKIKQRLYRRHRKRELRMECARRLRNRQQRRDLERDRTMHGDSYRSQRDVERDCIAIVNALIDDVIAKIAQDEYRCMRIKQRPSRMLPQTNVNVPKRTWKKELEPIDDREPFKVIKNGCVRFDAKERKPGEKPERHQIHGKLSLRPTNGSDDRPSKRIYQKSEIHDGNKCIEILEILEYVNGSQSSPENTNSDENQNQYTKQKKSRIPIPISERSQRSPSNAESQRNNNRRWSEAVRGMERNDNTNKLIADMLLEALVEQEQAPPPRRASVPAPHEPRERSNSLRFRQVFDIIPEERSSISLDSTTEELSHNRRASAPDIIDEYRVDEPSERECEDAPPALSPSRGDRIEDQINLSQSGSTDTLRLTKNAKCAATSPMSEFEVDKRGLRSKHQTTMTSPNCKSAATSPLRFSPTVAGGRGRGWAGSSRISTEGTTMRNAKPANSTTSKAAPLRSVTTQYESRRAVRAAPSERSERHRRAVRADGTSAARTCRRTSLVRSKSYDQVLTKMDDTDNTRVKQNIIRTGSPEQSEVETINPVKLPEFKGGGVAEAVLGGTSSDSSESGSSVLCPLAPRWLGTARARRGARRREVAPAVQAPPVLSTAEPDLSTAQTLKDVPGAWSVTVAGSCRAALPADVEMRLRFPHDRDAPPHNPTTLPCQECTCRHCAACTCSARSEHVTRAPPLPSPARPAPRDGKLTLTVKKEALDSSILASKSSRKSSAQLPDVETYQASRTRLRSSVKTRRGYSLHCWLPDSELAPIRTRNGLSVLGCAIVPELKPRVPTMSERDLTRVYTPRHYLRS